jgi:hypothetical protein
VAEIRVPIQASLQLRDESLEWPTLGQDQTKWRHLPLWQLRNSQK